MGFDMQTLDALRQDIRAAHLTDETAHLDGLIAAANISETQRKAISEAAAALIKRIRIDEQPGLMEVFLAEYGLSTDEGVALMCLAEALLRVPDAQTMDDLI